MIPESKDRPEGLNYFIQKEDWITQKMRIEKIRGTYKPKFKKRAKWSYP